MELDDQQRRAFLEREAEYDMQICPYFDLNGGEGDRAIAGERVICVGPTTSICLRHWMLPGVVWQP